MCPMCIASVAWIAVGAASTGGIAVVVAGKLCGRKGNKEAENTTSTPSLTPAGFAPLATLSPEGEGSKPSFTIRTYLN